jgi:DNA polymerase-1
MKRLVVIDGKSVFYRGYYAMGNLSLSDGTPTGGVYGFAAISLEILKDLRPDFVVVAWDKAKTNIDRRRKIYPGYKANRSKAPDDFYAQIPLLQELITALGWGFMEVDGYEADDIIGALARLADLRGLEAHSSVMLGKGELDALKHLGVNITCTDVFLS